MAMNLRTHLVEHASMAPDGLSACTSELAKHLNVDVRFHDHGGFLNCLSQIEQNFKLHSGDIHMVVVCTHGVEDTGTWLHVDDCLKDQRPEWLPHDLLKCRPRQLLVYTAVCWGGYPGLVRRFQNCAQPWPVVVGALAPLTAAEGNELQDEIAEVLTQSGLDERAIQTRVEAFNIRYKGEYGHAASRFISSAGDYVPKQGTAGIAWSLLRDEHERPFRGPYEVISLDKVRDRAQVRFSLSTGSSESTIPCGRLRRAKSGGILIVGDTYEFLAKRSPCHRYLLMVGDANVI